eukprot:scaffold11572_cov47-Phaeocystis_antarctica.AAC.2
MRLRGRARRRAGVRRGAFAHGVVRVVVGGGCLTTSRGFRRQGAIRDTWPHCTRASPPRSARACTGTALHALPVDPQADVLLREPLLLDQPLHARADDEPLEVLRPLVRDHHFATVRIVHHPLLLGVVGLEVGRALVVLVVRVVGLVLEPAVPPRVRDEDDDLAGALLVHNQRPRRQRLVAPHLGRLHDATLRLERAKGHHEHGRGLLELLPKLQRGVRGRLLGGPRLRRGATHVVVIAVAGSLKQAVAATAARTAGARSHTPFSSAAEPGPTYPTSPPFAVAPRAPPRRCKPPGACTAGRRC